jgi:hypothetical protein
LSSVATTARHIAKGKCFQFTLLIWGQYRNIVNSITNGQYLQKKNLVALWIILYRGTTRYIFTWNCLESHCTFSSGKFYQK